MEKTQRIDIVVELGPGDHRGKTALEWMLNNLDTEFELLENGTPKKVKSFALSIKIPLPGSNTNHPAYSFNFPDQYVLTKTLKIPAAATWFRLNSRIVTWLIAKFSQAGLAKTIQGKWGQKIALWLFMSMHIGSDICAVAIKATGRVNADIKDSKSPPATKIIGIVGNGVAPMTAIVASETVHQLLSENLKSGVFHIEQTIELQPIINALQKEIPGPVVDL